jgi:hypothetical protein
VKKDIIEERNKNPRPATLEIVPEGTILSPMERLYKQRKDSHKYPSVVEGSMRIEFNEKTNRVRFMMKNNHGLVLSPRLADILAIPQNRNPDIFHRKLFEPPQIEETEESESEVDIKRGRRAIFIYCSLVEDSVVGDTRAPLLRATVASGRYGDMYREVFDRPMYMPLRTSNFDMIEIDIKSETGESVPFNSGV